MIRRGSRLLVIGSHTPIGSALARRFRNQGKGRFFVVEGRERELLDRGWVTRKFRSVNPDIVCFAGGPSGGIMDNQKRPADLLVENLVIELNVLSAARCSRARRVIYFGSSCMYPREAAQPMKETALWSGPVEATSRAYAVAKLAGLEMGMAFDRQDETRRFLTIIPNNIYGPGDNFDIESSHVVGAMIRRFHEAKLKEMKNLKLWGSGRPRREFVHADDVADACVHLLSIPGNRLDSPINVGVGEDRSISDLAKIIRHIVGYRGKVIWDRSKPDGASRKWLDSRRLFNTGWRPRISLEEGLRDTYRYFLKQVANQ